MGNASRKTSIANSETIISSLKGTDPSSKKDGSVTFDEPSARFAVYLIEKY
jgi:hypothetical protein